MCTDSDMTNLELERKERSGSKTWGILTYFDLLTNKVYEHVTLMQASELMKKTFTAADSVGIYPDFVLLALVAGEQEDGTPKFESTRRLNGWKDIIKPDAFNIIDWINLDDNFYKIGSIIEGIQDKLHDGIALINLQKDQSKNLGMGGGFSEHLASLYLLIDYNRLTVRKIKEWEGINTNGKVFGFEIIDHGSRFNNIRPLIKCPECHGYGKVKNADCPNCLGSGWADVTIQAKEPVY